MIKTFPDERRVIEFIAGDDPSRTRTIISAVEFDNFREDEALNEDGALQQTCRLRRGRSLKWYPNYPLKVLLDGKGRKLSRFVFFCGRPFRVRLELRRILILDLND